MGGGPEYRISTGGFTTLDAHLQDSEKQQKKKKNGSPSAEHLLVILFAPASAIEPLLASLRAQHANLTTTYIQWPAGPSSSSSSLSSSSPPAPLPPSTYHTATILLTLSQFPSDPAHDAPRLHLVQLFSAGADALPPRSPLWDPSQTPRTTLTTSSGVHGPQIAEWTLLASLSHAHGLPALLAAQKRHVWDAHSGSPVRDFVAQRVGVLGYGSIGRQVGRAFRALGATIIAYTAHARETPRQRRDAGFIVPGTGDPDGSIPAEWWSGTRTASLRAFLGARLDVLVVCVPLTGATRGLLGREEFAALAAGKREGGGGGEDGEDGEKQEMMPFFANVSRGAVVQTGALVAALEARELRAAALDVTDPEPLPPESSLWSMPNVLVTPHISGRSEAYVPRCFEILGRNLSALRDGGGGELVNVVNRGRGY